MGGDLIRGKSNFADSNFQRKSDDRHCTLYTVFYNRRSHEHVLPGTPMAFGEKTCFLESPLHSRDDDRHSIDAVPGRTCFK